MMPQCVFLQLRGPGLVAQRDAAVRQRHVQRQDHRQVRLPPQRRR
jgi:hypothetical protein